MRPSMAPALQSSNTSVSISGPEELWEVGHEEVSWESGDSTSDRGARSGNERGGWRAASAAGVAAAYGDSSAVSVTAARAAAAGAAGRSRRGAHQFSSRRRLDAAQRIE